MSDLKDKFTEAIDQFDDLVLSKIDTADQCLKIAVNHAKDEAIGFKEWCDKLYVEQKVGLFDLGNGIINIDELKNITTSELYQTYQKKIKKLNGEIK